MERNDEKEMVTTESDAEERPGAETSTRGKEEGSSDNEAKYDFDDEEEEEADVDLELPEALQDLLSRLSAGGLSPGAGPVESLPDLQREEFGDFFRPYGRLRRTRTSVRLEVFEALAKCRTLRSFDSSRVQRWHLTGTEWEALLVPMLLQTNVHLEEIQIREKGRKEMVLLGKLIAQSQKLRVLEFADVGLSAGNTAPEIASGLRARVRRHYQPLERLVCRFVRKEGILSIVEIISSEPKLKFLEFYLKVELEEGRAKEALSSALKGLRCLKHLTASWQMADVIAEVYSGTSSSDPVLEHLQVSQEIVRPKPHPALALLLRGNITTITIASEPFPSEIRRSWDRKLSDKWHDVGKSLLNPPKLLKFQLALSIEDPDDFDPIRCALRDLWTTSQQSPKLHIQLDVRGPFGMPLLSELHGLYYRCVKSIQLYRIGHTDTDGFMYFVDQLVSSSSVEELGCMGMNAGDGWAYLFLHLRKNKSITSLDLSNSAGLNDHNFKGLIDLLQVNYTLRFILIMGTEWEADGKMALIREALQRNKKQEAYFSVLRQANLPFDGAKAGRIFLCGTPFAGKTRLKMTMMETLKKRSKSESALWIKKFGKWILKLQRTKGIEVESLFEDEAVSISIWDLAGQEFFRALHHLLFPRINQACVFVFLFNPFQGKSKKRLKSKMGEVFKQDLRSWLRFVVSNTQITGSFLPQMFVILTHKDKLLTFEKNLDLQIIELERIVEELQVQYKDVVKLCPVSDGHTDRPNQIYQVNATLKENVQPITDLLLSFMKEILERRSPDVPTVCSQLASHLLGRPPPVLISPLWPSEVFYKFCCEHTPFLEKFMGTEKFLGTGKGEKSVLRAVASYLHDVGVICLTPSAMEECGDILNNNPKKSVVVDLNWLTQNLLGKIIAYGHGFDENSGQASASHQIGIDGFLNREELYRLIEKITGEKSMNRELIRDLLFELDLCYDIESNGERKCFMPILFGVQDKTTSERMASIKLCWSSEPLEGSDHFGFRVQCYDKERTSLSPALFPRYQIHLRKQMEALGVSDENFIFSRYHVEIRHNGSLIFVEIDQSAENHIDIMVKFCKKRSRDGSMGFVQEHVVKGLIEFAASEKGCLGLELVVLILRTECVKQLTPRHLRTDCQAVMREELKRCFHKDIEKQLREDGVKSNSLFGYQHSWPEIRTTSSSEKKFYLPQEFQAVETLLSNKDVSDVLQAFQKGREDFWDNLQELKQVSSRLNDSSIKLELPQADPTCRESPLHRRHEHESFTSIVSRPSFKTRDDLGSDAKFLASGIVDLQNTIIKMNEEVKDMLRDFRSSLDKMHSGMSDLTSKVDKIIGYKRSKEAAGTPRRPFFTIEDVSRKGKLRKTLLFEKAVRLHFMCEARHRPHFVANQPGLELHFEKENRFSKAMRVLSVVSLHMIWVLLKVGAQVTIGLGDVVPQISELAKGVTVAVGAASNIFLDHLALQVQENLPLVEEQKSVEEAWWCLRDHLASNFTKDRCASLFRLHLVKYRNNDDPYAWLCEPCMVQGKRDFLLETEA